MWFSQFSSAKILLIVLLPITLLSEEVLYDGGQFRLFVPSGFTVQPALEYEGGVTHVFIRSIENKLASVIQISIHPPNPNLNFNNDEDIRRACIVGLNQLVTSLKRVRSDLHHSDPQDVEIGGLKGVRATWEANFIGSGILPELPERGVLYVIADENGLLSMRASGDERDFDAITLEAAEAIETMSINRFSQ